MVEPKDLNSDRTGINTKSIAEDFIRGQDAFGKLVADGTRNTVDIPSHYNFNPERHRLLENGSQVETSDISSQFTDTPSSYKLEPNAGNSLTLHTAERPRYIVGYESQVSTAGMLTSDLGSGDTYTVGMNDFQSPENTAYFEINGDSPNRIVLQKEDNEVASSEFTFPEEVNPTDPIRYEIQYNSYNVGRFQFKLSYTDDSKEVNSKQRNEIVGELVVDNEYALGDWNQHLFHKLNAANSGKGVEVGSFAYIILGNVNETNRSKGGTFRDLSYGGSGDYEALAALRVDPEQGNVYSQLQNVSVFPDGGSGTLIVVVVKESETDASGFSVPPEMSNKNSVVETTTNVAEFPDVDGNTVTSDPDPNGYQVGFTTFEQSGTGSQTRTQASQMIENKRPIYDDNVALFLYKADSSTARTVNVNYFVEQDW